MADYKSLEHWGREKAKARYNVDKRDTLGPDKEVQANQFPEDKHGSNYNNDASGWVRGMGKGKIETGEGKPAFDRKRSG